MTVASKKIKKILIANRGEIAVRIQRAAKEMGIQTVAVYSDVDRNAPHVLLCDEAYSLDGISSQETYLNIEKILSIARLSGTDAIHPGYGFLSEKAAFASAARNAGFIYIGPLAETVNLMGSKTAARELMMQKNIPIIPGTTKAVKNYDEAFQVINRIGLPILIKASGGGGGKGMRRVDTIDELEKAILRARNEANSAFADDSVYIEKYLEAPRHIEVQILADAHGNVVHLGERECSIQRRHQKVIEECPSSVLNDELRNAIGSVAVDVAKACNYVNAGTVEFLLDKDKKFYFLEMNTRIQVEHPTTEMVYGIDLVKTQIRIAEGEILPYTQTDIRRNGHAIECRIYAEDSNNNFAPSTGKIIHYAPSEGLGIRNDSGIQLNTTVTHYYDPLLAKLIVHGASRDEAICKMNRALEEYKIVGVSTTIPFCIFVLQHPSFIKGEFDIRFVDEHYRGNIQNLNEKEKLAIAVLSLKHKELNDVRKTNFNNKKNISSWSQKKYHS